MSVRSGYDLLLRGGRVICPASGIDGVFDVAVRDGRIAAIEPSILSEQRDARRSTSPASSCCRASSTPMPMSTNM